MVIFDMQDVLPRYLRLVSISGFVSQLKTAMRDSLQIPQLVFAMETFDNAVLSLSKITKLDLSVSTKNVARDFR